jgi:hypothetical protein
MKIQFNGEQSFYLEGKKVKCIFNPNTKSMENVDFAMFSQEDIKSDIKSKKELRLPGEFEISDVLIQGFYTDNNLNIVYKIVLDDIIILHTGQLKDIPNSDFFENIGDTIDVLLVNISEEFDNKLMILGINNLITR